MTLPVVTKTWQFSHITVPAGTTGLQELQHGLRVAVVGAFLGFGTGAATVAGSSDAVTAGMDGVNRWTTDGALVWNPTGNAHSWIVLNFGNKYFLLLDLNSFSPAQISGYLSFAGFTGGSTTTRPTATDEVQIVGVGGSADPWVNTTADVQRVWHVMMPTDSSAFRVMMYAANAQESWWAGGVAINTVAAWTHPIWGRIHFAQNLIGYSIYGNLLAFGGVNVGGVLGATPMNMGFLTEGASQALGQFETVVNDLDGGYPITSIGMYSNTVGKSGRMGQVEDLWWGSTTPATGDSYPADGSAQFMQIGNMVYPWDGTPLTIA